MFVHFKHRLTISDTLLAWEYIQGKEKDSLMAVAAIILEYPLFVNRSGTAEDTFK
jgi:hypothetical protein